MKTIINATKIGKFSKLQDFKELHFGNYKTHTHRIGDKLSQIYNTLKKIFAKNPKYGQKIFGIFQTFPKDLD